MKYPVCIPSLSRWQNNLTAKLFLRQNVDFKLFVEQKEYNQYKDLYGIDHVISLPGSNYGDVCFARNFIREYTLTKGFNKCWQLDDDISKIYHFEAKKIITEDINTIFSTIETLTDKYSNLGLIGLSGDVFARLSKTPYQLNTCIYTCFLVDNLAPFQYRPDIQEDYDFTLQLLTNGWCTLRFNYFMFRWSTTGSQYGGYTEAYKNGGRLNRMQNTVALWPIIPSVVFKSVNTPDNYRLNTKMLWKRFKNNKLQKI